MRDAPHTARTNSVFEESWWLEAVAPGQWREAVVRTDSALEARLPFVVKRRALLTMVVQPPLTPALGPWFGALPERYARRIARERELIDALQEMNVLPHVAQNKSGRQSAVPAPHASRRTCLPAGANAPSPAVPAA